MSKEEHDERTWSGGWGGDVNTNVQWCSVVKTKLDNIRVLCGGEVDCVRGASDASSRREASTLR